MRTLEIVHLRLAAQSSHALRDHIRESIRGGPDAGDVRVYRHATLASDLAVHLVRRDAGQADRVSDTGTRLASLLRGYGMVEHSVWVEEGYDGLP